MKLCQEEVVRAILEKLNLISGCPAKSQYEEVWAEFLRCHPQKAAEVPKVLAQLYQNIFAYYLDLPGVRLSDREKILDLVWQEAIAFLSREQQIRPVSLGTMQKAFKETISPVFPVDLLVSVEGRLLVERSPLIMVMADEIAIEKPTFPKRSRAIWKYQPLPKHEPDLHAESFCQFGEMTGGLQAIGARVRGKKHKHDGTNCDDWFEWSTQGDWQIVAVADGAGSKKFSRVGAKVSCQAAVRYLEEALEGCKLQQRQNWSVDTFKRDEESGAFAEEDLEMMQTALHAAMKVAFTAVENAVKERVEYSKYYKILGHRDINNDDLSATLLLAIHRMVNYKDTEYSLILTCQIGDGLTVAFDRNDNLHLLGIPDRGEFSGQTEFLTTPGKVERDHLMRKTFPFFSPLKALFVMTDGVADDYFPAETEMFRLYGDLLLNQIIPQPHVNAGEIVDCLSKTQVGNLADLDAKKDKFQSHIDRLISPEENPKTISIYTCDRYAKVLGIKLPDLLASPTLLAAIHWQNNDLKKCPAENLRLWLDSYQVKGSFDDRTLIILHPPLSIPLSSPFKKGKPEDASLFKDGAGEIEQLITTHPQPLPRREQPTTNNQPPTTNNQ